jgi:enediyne biosynthesis protein E4
VALLTRAGRADASIDEVRRALCEAGERLEALAGGPDPRGAETAEKFGLSAAMQTELRTAARDLAAASRPDAGRRIDTSPVLALLERVRAQREGAIALGLSLQGSYSQTKKKEPVYGGHASAMGPAPAAAPAGDMAGSSPVVFEEAARLPTRTFGGGPTKEHIIESVGNGVALLDYDGDGRLDIYLVTGAELTPDRARVPHRNALYRNLGGWRFEDVSAKAGVDASAWGNGACAGDVDDDGDLDLYVARYVATSWDEVVGARRTLVWRGGPRIMVGPAGLPGEADLFFENQGGGRFTEAAEAHGLSDAARSYGFAVVATDYDDDGLIDLFVANDSNPNFLYRNRGNGRFESTGLLAGVGVNGEARAQAGMGSDAGDCDGDGRIDLVLTAFAHDRNTLYRNIDGNHFEDATAAAGLAATTYVRMGWGAAFLDADLDGKLDLFFANGHIFPDVDRYPELGETYRQKNQLLLNAGARFRDVSEHAGAGLQPARVGRGPAVGDLDNDGDPDLIVSNMDDVPTLLENKQKTGHHWIAFRVVSPDRNRFAIGAKVTITAGGKTQSREIRSGGSYLSQSDLRPTFGLGGDAGLVTVDVRMPGGRRWRFQGLAADRLHVLDLSDAARRSRRSRAAAPR